MTNFEKVRLFMKTYGQEVKDKAGFSDAKTNKLRIDLIKEELEELAEACLLYTSPSPRDPKISRMPSSA